MATPSQLEHRVPLKVLLADTNRWVLPARIAMSLAGIGCEVSAVCPAPGHPLMKTSAVRRVYRYGSIHPLEALSAAIDAASPDIVVPFCDRSAGHLHELHAQEKARGEAGSKTAALIAHSLGSPESYPVVSSRSELLALAREEGIRVPNTCRITSVAELDAWCAREPVPWVLKADGTWGGNGVRVIRSREGSEPAFRQLNQIFRFSRVIKRFLINRDPFWFRPWWSGVEREVVAQSYIKGRPGNCAAVSWKGRLLGIICVEVVSSEGATGPAKVVRIIDNEEMKFAAERIAGQLHLSGFFGLDFMIEDGTNAAYLIEMNPRATPPSHLRLGRESDLVGALWSQLTGEPMREEQPVTGSTFIAYFPQAAHSQEDLPQDCFEDIPQGEPALVKDLLHPFPDRTILFRLDQWLRRRDEDIKSPEVIKPATL